MHSDMTGRRNIQKDQLNIVGVGKSISDLHSIVSSAIAAKIRVFANINVNTPIVSQQFIRHKADENNIRFTQRILHGRRLKFWSWLAEAHSYMIVLDLVSAWSPIAVGLSIRVSVWNIGTFDNK
jgi:hypothetical protein